MKIYIGWGSREMRFVPRNDIQQQHVEVKYVERGGFDAGPTGIEYIYTFDPINIDSQIERLMELKHEYLNWVEDYKRKFTELGD